MRPQVVPYVALLGMGFLFVVHFTNLQIVEVDNTHLDQPLTNYDGLERKFEDKTTNTTALQGVREFLAWNTLRLSHLLRRCDALNIPRGEAVTERNFSPFFTVCVPPKCGSSSWRVLTRQLPRFAVPGRPPQREAHLLVTRHPLSRLVSAYRDKYLNGAPIVSYNLNYQRLTHSLQPWFARWRSYWYPALLSRGDLKTPQWVKKRYDVQRAKRNPCNTSLPRQPRSVEWEFISHADPVTGGRFENATFTFLDFLKHVLWTRDHALIDRHWSPQYCLCDPCGTNYDYVLEMENISFEVRQVFDQLSIRKDVQISSVHSISKELSTTDAAYFDGIPVEIMKQIMTLYKNDFELYGYSYVTV